MAIHPLTCMPSTSLWAWEGKAIQVQGTREEHHFMPSVHRHSSLSYQLYIRAIHEECGKLVGMCEIIAPSITDPRMICGIFTMNCNAKNFVWLWNYLDAMNLSMTGEQWHWRSIGQAKGNIGSNGIALLVLQLRCMNKLRFSTMELARVVDFETTKVRGQI